MDIQFNNNMISDYEEIYSLNVDTKLFTELKEVEIINNNSGSSFYPLL